MWDDQSWFYVHIPPAYIIIAHYTVHIVKNSRLNVVNENVCVFAEMTGHDYVNIRCNTITQL